VTKIKADEGQPIIKYIKSPAQQSVMEDVSKKN